MVEMLMIAGLTVIHYISAGILLCIGFWAGRKITCWVDARLFFADPIKVKEAMANI